MYSVVSIAAKYYNIVWLRVTMTPVTMADINKNSHDKCWWACREKGAVMHGWWECRQVQPLWEAVWWSLKETEPPCESTVSLPSVHLWERRTRWDFICSPMFIAALLITAKTWQQPDARQGMHGWRRWGISHTHTHTHTVGRYSVMTVKESLLFATKWVSLEV